MGTGGGGVATMIGGWAGPVMQSRPPGDSMCSSDSCSVNLFTMSPRAVADSFEGADNASPRTGARSCVSAEMRVGSSNAVAGELDTSGSDGTCSGATIHSSLVVSEAVALVG